MNALLRELSADSEELDGPTDGPTAGIHTHAVVPKASEAEEFEEEEEEEEEEEDRKRYCTVITKMSRIKRVYICRKYMFQLPTIDFQGHHGAATTFIFRGYN